MKKLSEIGRELYSIEIDGLITCYTNDSPCDSPALSIIMSPEERRELVREALILLCKEWIYPASVWEEIEDAAMSQVDGLIKEQGI